MRVPKSFGLAVRARRRAVRLSQIDLAARAGVSQATISRIERGALAATLELSDHIAAALDAALVDVLSEAKRLAEFCPTCGQTREARP